MQSSPNFFCTTKSETSLIGGGVVYLVGKEKMDSLWRGSQEKCSHSPLEETAVFPEFNTFDRKQHMDHTKFLPKYLAILLVTQEENEISNCKYFLCTKNS